MSFEFSLRELGNKPTAPIRLTDPLARAELPTPALVINRAALSRNLSKMHTFLEASGKGMRSHSKTHKCPTIALQQISAGGVGICVAKIGEAAAMLQGGVTNLLITSPVATRTKARLLNHLLSQYKGNKPDDSMAASLNTQMEPGTKTDIDIKLVVDSTVGLKLLEKYIDPANRMGVLIDIDVSMGRTGVRDLETILSLIERVSNDSRFYFAGVQHYAGQIMHVESYAKRREKSLRSWEATGELIASIESRGFAVDVVTGGGTGTYDIDVSVAAITDLQVGSYIFMDAEYRAVHSRDNDVFDDFEIALTVLCSTISQPKEGLITVDGGYKAFASDSVVPQCIDLPDVAFRFAGDEHGVLILPSGEQEVRLGQTLSFATPHCDPTVNLHDYYWIEEADGRISECWPITARGCSW
tara:strand:+ start:510 stop:1748 length:1239 start_codon:yes stop_codon:yes gene_type:complete